LKSTQPELKTQTFDVKTRSLRDITARYTVVRSATMTDITRDAFEVYKEDFTELDTNKNGSLDPNELKTLIEKQLNRDPEKDEIDSFMDSVDLNQDGRLSLKVNLNSQFHIIVFMLAFFEHFESV